MMDPSQEAGNESVEPGLHSGTARLTALRNDPVQLPAAARLVQEHVWTTAVTLF